MNLTLGITASGNQYPEATLLWLFLSLSHKQIRVCTHISAHTQHIHAFVSPVYYFAPCSCSHTLLPNGGGSRVTATESQAYISLTIE